MTLDNFLGSDLSTNMRTLLGVTYETADYYGLDNRTAARVVNLQVAQYCPEHMPTLAAIGTLSRAAAGN